MIPPVHALLLALALAAAQGEDWEQGTSYEEERTPRVFFSVWGGEAFDIASQHGGNAPVAGAEVAYAFDFGELGVAGYGYELHDVHARYTPVALLRLTNRFETRRGLDATFTLGFGAGRPDHWVTWYQIALGLRLNLGPIWLGGELAFEQYNLLRLLGGVGVKF
jgi:hypothetical protein